LIGRALIEVAVAAGCSTVYATGKERQFQTIYDAGGAPLGRDPRLWRSLLSNKVDLIIGIDHSVGKSEINEDHVALLSRSGRLVLLCNPDRDETTVRIHGELIDFFKVNGRKLNLYNVFDAWENELKQCKRDLLHLLKLLFDGSIRPRILESIALNKVARAQDLLAEKKLNGFIICEPWMKAKKKEGYGVGEVYAESASKSMSNESLSIKKDNAGPCEAELLDGKVD
jgi:NADPH:quinone reductase-like Zn-dependent oxidoreductase